MSHASAETLAAPHPKLQNAQVNALQFFMICLAGWINHHQQSVIEYLQEEVLALSVPRWLSRLFAGFVNSLCADFTRFARLTPA
jgi:hypothetical protein